MLSESPVSTTASEVPQTVEDITAEGQSVTKAASPTPGLPGTTDIGARGPWLSANEVAGPGTGNGATAPGENLPYEPL